MLVALSWQAALAVDASAWVVWGVAVGWWMARRPVDALRGDGPLLRLRRFERGGRWYERRLGIKQWKGHLPEAGTWFGGLSKRTLPDQAAGGLPRYRVECLRAELTHWLALLPLVVFPLWSPWWLVAALAVGGLAFNVPCILVPRYNRARVDAALARRAGARPLQDRA
jgi:glycosyl-4,4'-diaponeurosporenoate acyltransferase